MSTSLPSMNDGRPGILRLVRGYLATLYPAPLASSAASGRLRDGRQAQKAASAWRSVLVGTLVAFCIASVSGNSLGVSFSNSSLVITPLMMSALAAYIAASHHSRAGTFGTHGTSISVLGRQLRVRRPDRQFDARAVLGLQLIVTILSAGVLAAGA